MPPWGCERGQRAYILSPWQCATHTTHRWEAMVCLLLLLPKLSVPAVLIVPVICGCRKESQHTRLDPSVSYICQHVCALWRMSVHTHTRVFTGKLNVSVHAHPSAVKVCPSLLSVFAAEGSRGIGSISRAASILSVPREIRHEIKAPIKGQGWHCHLIQHYLYSLETMMMSPSHWW